MAHLGQGVEYWLWSSMGLIEEFGQQRKTKLDPIKFIKEEQEKFVNLLHKISPTGSIYLSRGANKLFSNPLQDVEVLKNISNDIIQFAYEVRKEDITLEEFKEKISSM